MSNYFNGASVGLSGRYRLEVRKAATKEIVRETDWFDNLITDQGLNRVGSDAGIINGCSIGTGTVAPAFTDTSLATFTAYTTTVPGGGQTSGNYGGPNYTGYRQWAYQFQPGSLNGNYSEVGMGWASNVLFSRALILDGLQAPTTITVLSDEYLTVYYELRMTPPAGDTTGSVTISGVGTMNYTRRAQAASSWRPPFFVLHPCGSNQSYRTIVFSGPAGALITDSPSGASAYSNNNGAGSVEAYVNNSLERYQNFTFTLEQGNQLHRTYYLDSSPSGGGTAGCIWAIELASPFTKLNTQVLNLRFKCSWNRV